MRTALCVFCNLEKATCSSRNSVPWAAGAGSWRVEGEASFPSELRATSSGAERPRRCRTGPREGTAAAEFTPRGAPRASAWTVPGFRRSIRSAAMAYQRAEPAPSAACRGRCEENDGGREPRDRWVPRPRSGQAQSPGTRRWSAPTDGSRKAMSHGCGRHDAARGRLEGKPAGPVERRPRPRSLPSRSRARASGRTPRTG